jgi:hypothetical protein
MEISYVQNMGQTRPGGVELGNKNLQFVYTVLYIHQRDGKESTQILRS